MYNPSILNQYSAVKIRCVTKVRMQAQATEVYPCFLWSSHEDLLSPTENLLLRKMKVRPDEQSHGLGIQKSYCKRKMAFRRLWAKKPRHSQNIVAKIWYTIYLYRTTRLQESSMQKTSRRNTSWFGKRFLPARQSPCTDLHPPETKHFNNKTPASTERNTRRKSYHRLKNNHTILQ